MKKKPLICITTVLCFVVSAGLYVRESQGLIKKTVNQRHSYDWKNGITPVLGNSFGQLKDMVLSNAFGKFEFEKHGISSWNLKSHPEQILNQRLISEMAKGFENLNIKKIHNKKKLWKELSTPITKIQLNSKSGKKVELNFALINPITKSSYVWKSGDNSIYEIANLKTPVEEIGHREIFSTSIVAINQDQVSRIKLVRVRKNKSKPIFNLRFNSQKDSWYNSVAGIKLGELDVAQINQQRGTALREIDQQIAGNSGLFSKDYYRFTVVNKNKTRQTFLVQKIRSKMKALNGNDYIVRAENNKQYFIAGQEFFNQIRDLANRKI